VAEETESQDTGAEASGAGVDPAAVALALGGASREKADAFLDDQRALITAQKHHVGEQSKYLHEQFKHLGLSIWEKRTGVLLRAATAIVGVAVASFFGLMVWDATHSSGLIVEPFAVPSDMAAKGLTGQVVASQMLDKLSAMQEITYSTRPPQSYENNWGNNLKVEIPETGVSIGELQQFLKDWLGHDTHITGEVYRTDTGIAVTAREGTEAGATFTGPESDLDGLMQKAAEHVYSVTQPFRYANYLDRDLNAPDIADRAARASVIYRKLIAGPIAQEQAWGWYGLAFIESFLKTDHRAAGSYFQKAITINPDFILGSYTLANGAVSYSGRYENGLSYALSAKRLLDRSNVPDIDPRQLLLRRLFMDAQIALAKGDYGEALRNWKIGTDAPEFFDNAALGRGVFTGAVLQMRARLHDVLELRANLPHPEISPSQRGMFSNTALYVFRAMDDWPDILKFERETPKISLQNDFLNAPRHLALVALAHAHMGDLSGAEALIAQSPADCDDCTIARGQIADMQGQHDRADYWFARVEKAEPSIPFADAAWGQSMLDRGQPDAAIAKFTLANQKGPHFADPLEMWGEALMAKNQSHLALAKFAEAEKYAPNWGRLHLKWGEALGYARHKDEANVQYQKASTLDLTAADKAELARMSHG
jgi:tetratricopeptide (TPR) repeat protein